jgi:hypothetical protein
MAPIFEIKFEITVNFFSKLSFRNKIRNNRFEIPVFEIVSFEINLSYHFFHFLKHCWKCKVLFDSRIKLQKVLVSYYYYSFCTQKQIRLKFGDQNVTRDGGGGSKKVSRII